MEFIFFKITFSKSNVVAKLCEDDETEESGVSGVLTVIEKVFAI